MQKSFHWRRYLVTYSVLVSAAIPIICLHRATCTFEYAYVRTYIYFYSRSTQTQLKQRQLYDKLLKAQNNSTGSYVILGTVWKLDVLHYCMSLQQKPLLMPDIYPLLFSLTWHSLPLSLSLTLTITNFSPKWYVLRISCWQTFLQIWRQKARRIIKDSTTSVYYICVDQRTWLYRTCRWVCVLLLLLFLSLTCL